MQPRTRQRLVGILLLLVVAAALTPLLFRSPEQVRNTLDMRIPEAPEKPAVAVEPPVDRETLKTAKQQIDQDRGDLVATADQSLDSPESAASEPPQEAEEAPPASAATSEQPPLAGYAVQVGSFASPDNAQQLVEQLKDAGYRAYRRRHDGQSRQVERVMVGPEIRKADARETLERLENDSRFDLQGLLRSYVP